MNPTVNHQIFKQRAREILKIHGKEICITAALVIGVTFLLGKMSGNFSVVINNIRDMEFESLSHLARTLWHELTAVVGSLTVGLLALWGFLFSFAVGCVSDLLDYGLIDYTLRAYRGEVGHPQNVLVGFNTPFRILLAHLLRRVLTWLGTLCFIIPGFIVAYSLRMTERLLIDHPDWSITDCLQESRRMMRGHKFDLFVLDLSFIGWGLLEGFCKPVAIYSMPYRYLAINGFYEVLTQPVHQPEENPNPFADGGFEEENNVW